MPPKTISCPQLLRVLFVTLLPLGTEVLAGRLTASGSAAWLCPLVAGAVVLLLAALLGRRGLASPLATLGPRWGRVWAGVFLAWGLVLVCAQALRVGIRIAAPLRASPLLLAAAVLVLGGYLAAGGLPAFARACGLFAWAVGGGLLFLLVFGAFRLDWSRVLLWGPGDAAGVAPGALTTVAALAAGCYALFLWEDVAREPGDGRPIRRSLGRLFLLLSAAEVLVLGRLGPDLAGQIAHPFFQMASGLGFPGAFQRLEDLLSALWALGDVALLGLLLLAMDRLLAHLLGRQDGGRTWWLTGAALLLCLAGAPLWTALLAGDGLLWGSGLAGAAILLISARFQKK